VDEAGTPGAEIPDPKPMFTSGGLAYGDGRIPWRPPINFEPLPAPTRFSPYRLPSNNSCVCACCKRELAMRALIFAPPPHAIMFFPYIRRDYGVLPQGSG
jgi:hypothetical protein